MAIDLKKLKEKYSALQKARTARGFGGFWTPKDPGTYIIRILPPWNSQKGMYFRDSASHYGVGEQEKNFVCLRAEGQSCPICELRQALYDAKIEDLKPLANDLGPQTRIFMNIIDRGAPQLGVQVMRLSGQFQIEGIHEVIAGYCLDPQWGDLTDPYNGRDITIERKGRKLETEYFIRPNPNPTPISADQNAVNAVLNELRDLDAIIKPSNMADMQQAIAPIQDLLNRTLGVSAVPAAPAAPLKPEVKPHPLMGQQSAPKKPVPVKPHPLAAPGAAALAKPQLSVGSKPEVEKTVAIAEADLQKANLDASKIAADPKKSATEKADAFQNVAEMQVALDKAQQLKLVPEKSVPPERAVPSKLKIPEQYAKCFGLKYDAQREECQLCPYEAWCLQTQEKTKK